MSRHTWRELERADMDTAAAHAYEMEYRAEQIAREVQKRLARMEHIVNGLGEVRGEIVRCRSCVYFASNQPETGWCAKFGANTEQDGGDGFCAWGERRGK